MVEVLQFEIPRQFMPRPTPTYPSRAAPQAPPPSPEPATVDFLISESTIERLRERDVFLDFIEADKSAASAGEDEEDIVTCTTPSRMTEHERDNTITLANNWCQEFQKHCKKEVMDLRWREECGVKPKGTTSASKEKKLWNPGMLIMGLLGNCPTEEGKLNFAVEMLLWGLPALRGDRSTSSKRYARYENILIQVQIKIVGQKIFDGLRELGEDLLLKFISPFQIFRYDSKKPEKGLIPGALGASDRWPGAEDELYAGIKAWEDKVKKRDGCRCIITGALDVGLKPFYSRQTVSEQGFIFDDVRITHIVPPFFAELGEEVAINPVKKRLLSLLNICCPGFSEFINSKGPYSLENSISMTQDLFSFFHDPSMWLSFVRETNDAVVYRAGFYRLKEAGPFGGSPRGSLVKFSKFGELPLPDKNLLGLHRAVAISSGMCDATKLLDAMDEQVAPRRSLKEDGSSAKLLSDILTRRCFYGSFDVYDDIDGLTPAPGIPITL